MNALKLTEHLSNNRDDIQKVLESLDYQNITYNSSHNEYRFAREYGRNPSSVRLSIDTLSFICFSTNERGNLYSLVMNKKSLNFPQALEYIANLLGLEKSNFNKAVKVPFGGFYKKLIREIQEPEMSMRTYDESILDEYLGKFNTMFFNDGISYKTQEKFNVGYDIWTNRITVPEYTFDGKLCGIMGRSIDSNCAKEERWLPIIPCSRSLTLYGYHTNYECIQRKNLCVIGESEKFPQQLDTIGSNVGLGSCGCHLSDTQTKYIKGLLVSKNILAYDEGLEEEYIREEAKKLKIDNAVFHNDVGYIWDSEHQVIPKGSKGSPSDYGKEGYLYLMKNCVKWI